MYNRSVPIANNNMEMNSIGNNHKSKKNVIVQMKK